MQPGWASAREWLMRAPAAARQCVRRPLARALRLVAPVAILLASALPAQPAQPRPHLRWQSAATEHFVFHYPPEMERWTLSVAERMESVHEAVSRYVGWSPERPVHVIVDDPTNSSNGSAWPLLNAPAILLWPTPPDPTSVIGHSRGWGEMLAVHEYAHVAHLTRPTRNPRRRLLFSLLPLTPSPLSLSAPRWVFEGYATVVEGALTGSGRPYGVIRPAMLRQRALEGRLPTYGQLNALEGYAGGSMAYLAGSAYLEWLAERGGDSALVHLWRRMSARSPRGFGEAFAGVFGDAPQALYGRFTAEVTANAVAVEDTLRAAGLVTGDTILALEHGTGGPTVSPDDSLIAAVVRHRDRPPQIVVWQTAVDTAALGRRARERERMLRADPLDVAAVDVGPLPRRRMVVLSPLVGTRYDAPRFLPDGRRMLVWRSEPLGDGAWRGDIGIWTLADGSVRRVTYGAGVHDAAPLHDGQRAVAVRCANGICDLVEIALATGAITVLAPGSIDAPWAHPAPSPDDRWIAASRPNGGVWEIVRIERRLDSTGVARAGDMRPLSFSDGASRYQPVWLADGPLAPGVLVVSEAGGIANLELIPLRSPDAPPGRPRTLTRVTGSVASPAVPRNGRAVYFLSMHSGGLDVQRLSLADSADPSRPNPLLSQAAELVRLSTERTAVAPPVPIIADTFARGSVRTLGAYRVGPRRYAVWPVGGGGATGAYGGLALVSGDPVGRLTWALQGVYAKRELWRGGALGVAWRGMRPAITGTLFYAEQRPSRQSRVQPSGLDIDYRGATLVAELPLERNGWTTGVRAGGSAGTVSAPGLPDDASRRLGFAELRGQISLRSGTRALALGATLHGAAGRTGDASWRRGMITGALGVAFGRRVLRASITAGTLGGEAGEFERFIVGGIGNPFIDDAVLSQRLSHPALPLGVTSGTEVVAWRVATRVGGAELYLWNASALGWRNEQHRVAGLERSLGTLRLPIVSVPGIEARAGIAYSIDAPFRRELRVYGWFGIVP
jgi:hypothetical protein